ncbi:hypothetical protein Tco_0545470 [Tanacetum coccineum]
MVDTFCRPPKGGAEAEQIGFLLSRMDGLILINIPDRWVWSLEAASEFSVKYVRQLIDDSILPKNEVATSDSARTFRVILFSIHSDEWKSFQCQYSTTLWQVTCEILYESNLCQLDIHFGPGIELTTQSER